MKSVLALGLAVIVSSNALAANLISCKETVDGMGTITIQVDGDALGSDHFQNVSLAAFVDYKDETATMKMDLTWDKGMLVYKKTGDSIFMIEEGDNARLMQLTSSIGAEEGSSRPEMEEVLLDSIEIEKAGGSYQVRVNTKPVNGGGLPIAFESKSCTVSF